MFKFHRLHQSRWLLLLLLNMLLLPVALMAGAPITPVQVLLMNILPVSIGNAIGGSVLVGASMTYSFGKFGRLRRR